MLCKKRGSKGLFVSVTYFAVIVFSLISFVQTNSVENNRQDVDAVDKKDVRKQKGNDIFFILRHIYKLGLHYDVVF